LAIINTALKTNTTSAMPSMVMIVVSRREDELRKIYFSGTCTMDYPTCRSPSTMRVVSTRRNGTIAATSPTTKLATQPIMIVSGLM